MQVNYYYIYHNNIDQFQKYLRKDIYLVDMYFDINRVTSRRGCENKIPPFLYKK